MSGSGVNWTGGPTQWKGRLQTTGKGKEPIPNLYNTLLALRNDPKWVGSIQFDEMLQCAVNPPHPIDGKKITSIQEWLQENGIKRVGRDTVRDAIELVAHEHCFHPLRERLDQLASTWDHNARLDTWLIRFLGAEDNEYHKEIAFRFPIAMVARVFNPGCKMDYMMVLEGPQGALKSTIIREMALGYFSDALPDLDDDTVRLSMHLRGKWLIELSELASISKTEASLLKAFLTRPEEKYTPKFGRGEVIEPRQCCFVGTINEDTYLKDETGNRRFWPVKCGNIDLDGLRAEWEQVLGEAVAEYKGGTPWWPDRTIEATHFKPQQDARQWTSALEQRVQDYLDGHYTATGAVTSFKSQISILSVAEECLGLQSRDITVPKQKEIAAILRHLGWEFKRSKTSRMWHRP